MKLDMLESLNDEDLRAVDARCLELLKQHDTERKDMALADAAARLAEVGLTLKDLINGKGKTKAKGPVYYGGHEYQHPTEKSLIWKGTGKKPHWLRELEASGVKAVEL